MLLTKNTISFLVICFVASAVSLPELNSIAEAIDRLVKSWTRISGAEPMTNAKQRRSKRQTTDIGDESPLPFEIRTSSLPMMPDRSTINERYMPTLGNGYLGTTAYTNSIYLNGLFNGAGSSSHRAKIPAIISTRVELTTPDFERRAIRKFTLNAQDGYFMETIKCEFADIEHRIYVHQKYIRLFVVDIFVRMNPATLGGGTITLSYPSWNISNDIVFDAPRQYRGNWQVKGTTKEAENSKTSTQQVNVFYMMPLRQISISGSNRESNYTMIMAIDKVEGNARQEFDSAQTILQAPAPAKGNHNLFMEHVNEWRKLWAKGRVEVVGADAQLTKAVNFAQFYIMNSLPAESPALAPVFTDPFYGCGRTSIGKGGNVGKDYQGHVMWDNEVYIMPAILPFHPLMAKSQLRYRSATMAAAAGNAARIGSSGIYFPWRSGLTGAELSEDSCTDADQTTPEGCVAKRIYVTAGVMWAIRQYYSVTRDRDFMINPVYKGCDLSRDASKFLASQAKKNSFDSRYDIDGITGPDGFHPKVSNDIFTVCSVSLALHWARYYSCLCQRNENEEAPMAFQDIAMYLRIPFDYDSRTHYQFTDFDAAVDRPIMQADTVMLIHPLNWNYSYDIMKNDLLLYETLIDPNTPAMTWSWYTIGWKWVNEKTRLNSYFLKSYKDYTIQPFKIWTEYRERNPSDQAVGNVNFLPGMGAFLQSIIYGFGGLRIRPDKLDFHNPIPPPGAKQLILRGFQYLQSNLTFIIEADRTTVEAVFVPDLIPLILKRNETSAVEESLTTGARIVIEKVGTENPLGGFSIYTSVAETCPHPRDYTYMPYGYGFWPSEIVATPVPASAQFAPVWAMLVLVIVITTAILIVYCIRFKKPKTMTTKKYPIEK